MHRHAGRRETTHVRIEKGFQDGERPRVAALYWNAFGPKLGRTLGPEDRGKTYVVRALRADHAICARDGQGALTGVAGFKTAQGALVDGTFADMAAVYGRIGAAWRMAVLALLSRDTENARFLMDGLFVDPAVRGQGVGTQLLEGIVQEARDRGYTEVRLDVIDGNDRARALYARRGFEPVGTRSIGPLRHVFGFRSATTMVRRIG